jgi:Tol biopolymer transport system component
MKTNYLFKTILILFLVIFAGAANCFSQLAIRPARTISFMTDVGTDMSVDVSPDGKTLIFDLLGDLYTVPVTGGSARQITRGIALNTHPKWSPDGRKIAYLSDYSGSSHINVRNVDGTMHIVLGQSDQQFEYFKDPYPIWASNGNSIAVKNKIYDINGGQQLLPMSSFSRPLRFSIDGRLLYYIENGRLYEYDSGRNSSMVIPVMGVIGAAISPNGHWCAYVRDSNSKKCLVIRDLNNNDEHILVASLLTKYPYEYLSSINFAFSPDSKTLYIGYGGKIHRINVANGEDRVIPFQAHVKVDTGPFDYQKFGVREDSFAVKYTRSVNASPDGKHLVFMALDKLYVMDLPDGEPHPLVDQSIGQFQPVYSPDGQWIAFVSWCDTLGGYLWRVRVGGGQPERLTSFAGEYQRPSWSPNSQSIAVVKGDPRLGDRDDPQRGQIEIVPVNGGPIQLFPDTVPLWNQLTFSPDGLELQYEPLSNRDNKILSPLLVSRNTDGSDPQVLATGRSGNYFAQYIQHRAMSPDGRYIVYSMGEDLYMVAVNQAISPTVLYDCQDRLSAIRFAAGADPAWEQGGKVLSWSYGNRFYRINPDRVIAAAQVRKASGLADSAIVTVKVHPDETIALRLNAPSFHAHGVIVLTHARIITMKAKQIIEDGTIVIKDGRFLAVGPTGGVSIPSGGKVINLKGTTVMPGFVDLHLHMRTPPEVFPQQSWMYLVNLAYGVTTARDPSSSLGSFGNMELIKTGQMIGPRLYSVGQPVRMSEGVVQFENLSEARAVVRKRAAFGATTIKEYLLPTRLQRQWLLMASREAGLNMTNEGESVVIVDIAMIKDGTTGIEHNPDPWGDVYKDVTTLFARSGTYFTPTFQERHGAELMRAHSNYLYWRGPDAKLGRFTPDRQLNYIVNAKPVDTAGKGDLDPTIIDAEIRHLGGRVTLGSHGNDEGIGAHNELWALKMGGLTNMEALQAATIMGAEALGVQKDLGSIEVGKIADLIVLNKNPLDDIHNSREIRYVMKDGILYDGDTLDILWPFYKKCPEWRLKSGKEKAEDSTK